MRAQYALARVQQARDDMLTALTCPAAGMHRCLGPAVTACVHAWASDKAGSLAQGGQLDITFDKRICGCTLPAITSV